MSRYSTPGVGRKPVPRELKSLQGDDANRWPLPEGNPEPPAYLSDAAKVEWHRVLPILNQFKLYTDIDVAALAAYCQCYTDWVDCVEKTEHTPTILDGNGIERIHPLRRHALELLRKIKEFAAEFGFSPSARARIELPRTVKTPEKAQEQDQLDQFMSEN